MAIPKSAYPPPFNVTRASHVVITSRDLGASRAFYVDMLGLIVSDEDANTLYLRGLEEACHHSLVIKRAGEAVCERVGMRVYAESDLDAAFEFLSRRSIACRFVEVPYQGKTLHFNDASGCADRALCENGCEAAAGRRLRPVPCRRAAPARPFSDFDAGSAGRLRFLYGDGL